MRISFTILFSFFLLGISAQISNKLELHDYLLGTWIHEADSELNALRYVRAENFKKNIRGFTFKEDGILMFYEEFGCQIPPNFRNWQGAWIVKRKNKIILDRFPTHSEQQIIKILYVSEDEFHIIFN